MNLTGKWMSVCALTALLVFSIGAAGDKNATESLKRAADYARHDNYTSAAKFAREAASSAKDANLKGRALFLAGYSEYRLKNYDTARSKLKTASGMFPLLSYHGLYYGALSYQEEDRRDEALKLWEKLLAADPPGDLAGEALMNVLRCQRRNGDAPEALVTLDRLKSLSYKDASWVYEREYTKGWAKAKTGAVAEARKILLGLWRDNPSSYWAGLAEEYLNGGEGGAILLPGETSAITDGDRVQRVKNLIDSYQATKALDELGPLLKKAETGGSKARYAGLLKLAGEAYMKKREYTNALNNLEKAQSLLDSEDVEISYLSAECHRRSGRHNEAIGIYRHIWTDHAKCAYATRSLFYAARLMKLANDWDGAEACYRKLVDEYPRSTLRPESLFQLAWIKFLRKDYEKAKLYMTRVPASSRDDEFNARTVYWKSVILHELGEHQAARAAEDVILSRYWKSNYAFYLTVIHGREWPYPGGGKVIPRVQPDPPREYKVASKLLYLGLNSDAEGQLTALEADGKLPEWLVWSISRMYLDLEQYYSSQRMSYRHLGHRLATPPPGEMEAWRISYPQAFPELVKKYARQNNIDPLLVWSLMRAESTYRPDIKSSAGAIGLMQIMPTTGRQIAKGLGDKGFSREWLEEPERNVRYGCFYLRGRLDQFSGEGDDMNNWLRMVTRSLASYNAGPGRVMDWGERTDKLGLSPEAFVEEIPIKETREYVQRIFKFYLIYLTAWPRDAMADAPASNPADGASVVSD